MKKTILITVILILLANIFCGCLDSFESDNAKAESIAADYIVSYYDYVHHDNIVNVDAYDDGDRYVVEVDTTLDSPRFFGCFVVYKDTWETSGACIL